jgi:hypothetical protein
VEGCAECLRIGGQWVHLRMCQSCGKVGCEDWSWCMIDEVTLALKARLRTWSSGQHKLGLRRG